MIRDLLYEDVVAAHLLGVTRRTIVQKCRGGGVPGAVPEKVGRKVKWFVPLSWLGPEYARSSRRAQRRPPATPNEGGA